MDAAARGPGRACRLSRCLTRPTAGPNPRSRVWGTGGGALERDLSILRLHGQPGPNPATLTRSRLVAKSPQQRGAGGRRTCGRPASVAFPRSWTTSNAPPRPGNGTQARGSYGRGDVFSSRRLVTCRSRVRAGFSAHYGRLRPPETKDRSRRGGGAGEKTANCPLEPGAADEAWLAALGGGPAPRGGAGPALLRLPAPRRSSVGRSASTAAADDPGRARCMSPRDGLPGPPGAP